MKNDDQDFKEFGEWGARLLSFEQCMQHMAFPGSIYTFRRRIDEMIEAFGGPYPAEPGHFSFAQLNEFAKQLPELSRLRQQRRTEKKNQLSQNETEESSND